MIIDFSLSLDSHPFRIQLINNIAIKLFQQAMSLPPTVPMSCEPIQCSKLPPQCKPDTMLSRHISFVRIPVPWM